MPESVNQNFIESTIKLFGYYKSLGEKTFDQLTDKDILWQSNDASNSIAIIVHHLSGNMLSRWPDFMTTDGEKPWRNRDAEFAEGYADKKSMLEAWDKGWECLMKALQGLGADDLDKIVYIRNEGQTVFGGYSKAVGSLCFAYRTDSLFR